MYKAYLYGLLGLSIEPSDLGEEELCCYAVGRADRGDTHVGPLQLHSIRTVKDLITMVDRLRDGSEEGA